MSQKSQYVLITKTTIVLFLGKSALSVTNITRDAHTDPDLCTENVQMLNIKAYGTLSSHSDLKE